MIIIIKYPPPFPEILDHTQNKIKESKFSFICIKLFFEGESLDNGCKL